MSIATKSERRGAAAHSPWRAAAPASSQARRQAAAILEVLAGVRRPSEAAELLGISLPRYYQLERRALVGLLAACEPSPRGPRLDLSRRITALERENRRLQRECDRQQALVRVAERSLGLSLPTVKLGAKAHETKGQPASPNGAGTKRRRRRRPTVRALKVAQALQTPEQEMEVAAVAAEVELPGTESG